MSSGCWTRDGAISRQTVIDASSIDHGVQQTSSLGQVATDDEAGHRRAGDRRHRRGQGRRRRRRRGPRERGRPDLRRREGDSRTGRVHGPLHLGLPVRAAGRRRSATGSACCRCTRSTRTSTAPPTPSPSTPRRVSAPVSRPRTGPPRCGCSPIPTSIADDFTKPGHVVPLRAKDGGVLRRPGHTEAAVDLARMAGLQPAGAICEIVSQKDEGAMAQTDELRVFADEHGLALISIADLIEWRRKHEKHIERVAEARIPTRARRVPRGRLHQHLRRGRARRPGPRRHRRPDERRPRRAGAGALRMPHR